VEDRWLSAASQRHLKGIQTELRVKAVREVPAKGVPGEEFNDPHQVEEPLLQRDVDDIRGPDLSHSRDCVEIHQAGKAFCWISLNSGTVFPIDRP